MYRSTYDGTKRVDMQHVAALRHHSTNNGLFTISVLNRSKSEICQDIDAVLNFNKSEVVSAVENGNGMINLRSNFTIKEHTDSRNTHSTHYVPDDSNKMVDDMNKLITAETHTSDSPEDVYHRISTRSMSGFLSHVNDTTVNNFAHKLAYSKVANSKYRVLFPPIVTHIIVIKCKDVSKVYNNITGGRYRSSSKHAGSKRKRREEFRTSKPATTNPEPQIVRYKTNVLVLEQMLHVIEKHIFIVMRYVEYYCNTVRPYITKDNTVEPLMDLDAEDDNDGILDNLESQLHQNVQEISSSFIKRYNDKYGDLPDHLQSVVAGEVESLCQQTIPKILQKDDPYFKLANTVSYSKLIQEDVQFKFTCTTSIVRILKGNTKMVLYFLLYSAYCTKAKNQRKKGKRTQRKRSSTVFQESSFIETLRNCKEFCYALVILIHSDIDYQLFVANYYQQCDYAQTAKNPIPQWIISILYQQYYVYAFLFNDRDATNGEDMYIPDLDEDGPTVQGSANNSAPELNENPDLTTYIHKLFNEKPQLRSMFASAGLIRKTDPYYRDSGTTADQSSDHLQDNLESRLRTPVSVNDSRSSMVGLMKERSEVDKIVKAKVREVAKMCVLKRLIAIQSSKWANFCHRQAISNNYGAAPLKSSTHDMTFSTMFEFNEDDTVRTVRSTMPFKLFFSMNAPLDVSKIRVSKLMIDLNNKCNRTYKCSNGNEYHLSQSFVCDEVTIDGVCSLELGNIDEDFLHTRFYINITEMVFQIPRNNYGHYLYLKQLNRHDGAFNMSDIYSITLSLDVGILSPCFKRETVARVERLRCNYQQEEDLAKRKQLVRTSRSLLNKLTQNDIIHMTREWDATIAKTDETEIPSFDSICTKPCSMSYPNNTDYSLSTFDDGVRGCKERLVIAEDITTYEEMLVSNRTTVLDPSAERDRQKEVALDPLSNTEDLVCILDHTKDVQEYNESVTEVEFGITPFAGTKQHQRGLNMFHYVDHISITRDNVNQIDAIRPFAFNETMSHYVDEIITGCSATYLNPKNHNSQCMCLHIHESNNGPNLVYSCYCFWKCRFCIDCIRNRMHDPDTCKCTIALFSYDRERTPRIIAQDNPPQDELNIIKDLTVPVFMKMSQVLRRAPDTGYHNVSMIVPVLDIDVITETYRGKDTSIDAYITNCCYRCNPRIQKDYSLTSFLTNRSQRTITITLSE